MRTGRGKGKELGSVSLQKLLVEYKFKVVALIILIILAAASDIYAGYTLTLYYDIIVSPNIQTAIFFSLYMMAVWVFSVVMDYFVNRYKAVVVETFNNELKIRMIDNISVMEYEEYIKKEPGEYASWLTNDIKQIEEKCIIPFFSMCESFGTILFSIIALKYMHPIILGACIISSIVMYFVPRIFQNSIQHSVIHISELNEKFSQKIYDTLSGFEAFISNSGKNIFNKQNKYVSSQLEKEKRILTQKIAKLELCSTSVFRIFENCICCLTAVMAYKEIVGVGMVFSIGNISNRFLNGINNFFANLVVLKGSVKLFEKFDNEIKIDEKEVCPNIRDRISLHDITIAYGDHIVMKKQNFDFAIGKKYAIVGESGSGKTSLVKAMVGFNNSYKGNIYFDEVNKDKYSTDSILSRIAYVSQEAYIFNDTIRFNLTLGREEFTEKEISRVLKDVNLEEFINKQEHGIDTVLSDGGRNVSGGQRQRIVIARALLLKKNIFILDEGTSALDSKNVQIIEELLLTNPNYTVILITHNMGKETEKYFERIYDFDAH